MKVDAVFLVLFTLASAGPILGSVMINYDDLSALVLSESMVEAIEDFQEVEPHIVYVGYEVIDPDESLRIFFNISSPYNTSISITSLSLKCYCHEHETFIGTANGEALPLNIPANGTAMLCIILQFTQDGKNDVLGHYDSSYELYIDLREVIVVIQGIEASYEGDLSEIGPIPLH
jgi:hypothetical protein